MNDNRNAYEIRTDPETWRQYNHDELVHLIIGEVVAADAMRQHERELRKFHEDQTRTWAARVWSDNRRGALVYARLREAQKRGRKTVRIDDLLGGVS